jgi:hypothetical protein
LASRLLAEPRVFIDGSPCSLSSAFEVLLRTQPPYYLTLGAMSTYWNSIAYFFRLPFHSQ